MWSWIFKDSILKVINRLYYWLYHCLFLLSYLNYWILWMKINSFIIKIEVRQGKYFMISKKNIFLLIIPIIFFFNKTWIWKYLAFCKWRHFYILYFLFITYLQMNNLRKIKVSYKGNNLNFSLSDDKLRKEKLNKCCLYGYLLPFPVGKN